MEVQVTTDQGISYVIDVDVEAPKRPSDPQRYSTFNFTCKRFEVPIDLFYWIRLTDAGRTLFRGYVYYYKKEGEKVSVQCRGEEELAMHRYTPRHGYQCSGGPQSTNDVMYLCHAFEDNAPHQTADPYNVAHNQGLIFLMNSCFPQTLWTIVSLSDPTHAIIELPGWGSNSRIGTTDIYVDGTLFPTQPTYSAMQSTQNSNYRDANNLYIDIDINTYVPAYRVPVCPLNGFDTHIRTGKIDKNNAVLGGLLQLNNHRYADVMINLAWNFGLTPHWRYTDSYTYFDAVDES